MTYPRLGISAHIHFLLEGIVILSSGFLLHLQLPIIQKASYSSSPSKNKSKILVDTLSPWQSNLIYYALALSWPLLISEIFNAWWGTNGTSRTVAEMACVSGGGKWWQEVVTGITHFGSAVPQLCVVSWFCSSLIWYKGCWCKAVADYVEVFWECEWETWFLWEEVREMDMFCLTAEEKQPERKEGDVRLE